MLAQGIGLYKMGAGEIGSNLPPALSPLSESGVYSESALLPQSCC